MSVVSDEIAKDNIDLSSASCSGIDACHQMDFSTASHLIDDSKKRTLLMTTSRPPIGCGSLNEIPPCAVCGSFSAGRYNDVYACGKCKGFFEQTVEHDLAYTCQVDGKCGIDMFDPHNCHFCWFCRCVEAGMQKKGVDEGMPLPKKMRLENNTNFCDSSDVVEMGLKNSGNQCKNGSVSDEKQKIDSPLLDEEKHLIARLVEIEPDAIPLLEELLPDYKLNKVVDVNVFLNWGYAELRLIIAWSRRVPGFCDLLLGDQMALLRSSFSELSTLRLAYRSVDCTNKLGFTRSFSMTTAECVQAGCGIELLEPVLEFISRLRAIGMDRTEFSILNAVVLTYPDAAGVVDRRAVIELQSRILKCLQKYSSSRYSATPYRYGKILLRLPALRTISARFSHKFLDMSLEGDVQVNAVQ